MQTMEMVMKGEFENNPLVLIRKDAGFSQSEVANLLNVNVSTVSRLESNHTLASHDELNNYASVIGTDKARQFVHYLNYKKHTSRILPKFSHPNILLLIEIDIQVKKIDEQLESVNPSSIEYGQLKLNKDSLNRIFSFLFNLNHRIVFVGAVGVGKTETICRLLNLTVDGKSLLTVGSGRTTVAQVNIKKGSSFRILIEKYSEDEILKFAEDFCSNIWDRVHNSDDFNSGNAKEEILPSEIEKVLRNFSGLKKDFNKKIDSAEDFAKKFDNKKDFINEFELKLKLKKRIITEIEFESFKDLQDGFKKINTGNFDGVSLPRIVHIVIPSSPSILFLEPFNLELIDTKGIDDSAYRSDLDLLIRDPRSLVVFCSSFNDAPNQSISNLIEQIWVSSEDKSLITHQSTIFALHKNKEAEDVLDDNGDPLGSRESGYNRKKSEIQDYMNKRYKSSSFPITIYDALFDDADKTANDLLNLLNDIRNNHIDRAKEIFDSVNQLISNIKTNEKRINQKVYERLSPWLQAQKNQKIVKESIDQITQSLIITLASNKHPGIIRASINRNGIYDSLNFYSQLGFGCRLASLQYFSSVKAEFNNLIGSMLADENFSKVHKSLKEIQIFFSSEFENVLSKISELGFISYKNGMFSSDKWINLKNYWGKGTGYTQKVIDKTDSWLHEDSLDQIKVNISDKLTILWVSLIEKIEKLVKTENDNSNKRNINLE